MIVATTILVLLYGLIATEAPIASLVREAEVEFELSSLPGTDNCLSPVPLTTVLNRVEQGDPLVAITLCDYSHHLLIRLVPEIRSGE